MEYLLEIRNGYTLGSSRCKCKSMREVQEILENNYFDGELKLYKLEEVALPCDYEIAPSIKRGKASEKLYYSAMVSKDYFKEC